MTLRNMRYTNPHGPDPCPTQLDPIRLGGHAHSFGLGWVDPPSSTNGFERKTFLQIVLGELCPPLTSYPNKTRILFIKIFGFLNISAVETKRCQ